MHYRYITNQYIIYFVKGVSHYKYFRTLLLESSFLTSCSKTPFFSSNYLKYAQIELVLFSANSFHQYLLENKDSTILNDDLINLN